jgi:6,7-dimethyl-8-ribityllumazine synthase
MAAGGQSVLIIEGRFYEDIANELVRGAVRELESHGVAYETIAVPGALEIPVALSIAISGGVVGPNGRHGGCVALGCVIRGETSHYDIVAGESARALLDLGAAHAVPVGNVILTVDTRDPAWERARIGGKSPGGKGGDAAAACLSLIAHQADFAAGRKQ